MDGWLVVESSDNLSTSCAVQQIGNRGNCSCNRDNCWKIDWSPDLTVAAYLQVTNYGV